jgi:hypothetical protein
MANVYIDTTKQGRDRYSGPATYGGLGEEAINLAWERRSEAPIGDEMAIDLWWLNALDQPWWEAWMEEFRIEAREVYESALKAMRAESVTESRPDALTRLGRLMKTGGNDPLVRMGLDLISEARREMEALRRERDALAESRRRIMETVEEKESQRRGLQERVDSLSNKSSEALRMGQQQGRVELAEEILSDHGVHPTLKAYLDSIIDRDAGQ